MSTPKKQLAVAAASTRPIAAFARPPASSKCAITMQTGMVKRFEDLVYEGRVIPEMKLALQHVLALGRDPEATEPLGLACPTADPNDLHAAFKRTPAPAFMTFSATLWMLDLEYRVTTLDRMDYSRMRWALETITTHKSVERLLKDTAVAAEGITNESKFSKLRKIDRDADIDVVVLAAYWHNAKKGDAWWAELRDLQFSAQLGGSGYEVTVKRFMREDEEEKKRNVMGYSAFRRAQDLQQLVKEGAGERGGLCDAGLAAKLLEKEDALRGKWGVDTCRRYLAISGRFNSEGEAIMSKWEMKFGRSALLDSLNPMRSATTAAQTPEEMTTLVRVLFWEQTCKIRTSLGQRGRASGGDFTALFRALLLRQLFYQYMQQLFPKLHDVLSTLGTWKWYQQNYDMDEHGRLSHDAASSDGDEDKPNQIESDTHQTRFESKRKLKMLVDQIARGKHDHAFTCMARHTSSAINLDLGCDGMKSIQKQIQDIYVLYKEEFPEVPASIATTALPSAEIQMHSSAGEYTPAQVKGTSAIETEEEYQAKLSAYNEQCRQAVEESAKQYVEQRIALVISDLDGQKIAKKLEKVSFMREPGRKLFIYDSLCQDPLNWSKLRKMKRSFLTGARVAMHCQQAGQVGQDTLLVVKDTYLAFRTERQPDQLCEDVVACIVPGTTSDNPRNDTLDAAWRSLKALGNKHVGPKIGTIVINKAELLQQVYSRGAWHRTPDHHLVFTYQAAPRHGQTRKRMKFLTDGSTPGDTAFNVWPVPLVPVANMPKASSKTHDQIFEDDVAQDSGADDGSGAAVVEDLGDNFIPFPRESHEKLTREMIHVWEIDVGVLFNPGAGKSCQAFLLENRRAVAIVKNKAHKEYVMSNLTQAVKTQNMAVDTRPARPAELAAWETRRPQGGMPASTPVPRPSALTPAPATLPGALATLPPPPEVSPPAPAALPSPPAAAVPPAPAAATGIAGFGAAILR
jgi:hypothetical protein